MTLTIASFIFVACAICGFCDSATIYTRSKGNATNKQIGGKDILNENNRGLKPDGSFIKYDVKAQDARTVICPAGYEPVDVYCYKITLQVGEQSQHRDLCFQSGGYLIAIQTSEENAALINYMRRLNLENHQHGLYIGVLNMHWGTKFNPEYGWMYDSVLSFTNWLDNRTNGRECGFVFLLGDRFGKWGTGFCQRLRGAICEADPLAKFSVAVTV